MLDEPVSALDVSIRAQIMNLLKDLQSEYNVSYMLIAHHLATVRYMCTWVAVMYLGRIVELSPVRDLFENPSHPYTKALMSAALPSHPDIVQDEMILTGEVPSPPEPAGWMPLPHPLPLRHGRMQPGRPGGEGSIARPHRRLPPVLNPKGAGASPNAARLPFSHSKSITPVLEFPLWPRSR